MEIPGKNRKLAQTFLFFKSSFPNEVKNNGFKKEGCEEETSEEENRKEEEIIFLWAHPRPSDFI